MMRTVANRIIALCITFVYETWLGFRSGVLSHVTKRNLKTKLQIYTEPQPCFIHFVGNSWASRCHFLVFLFDLFFVEDFLVSRVVFKLDTRT